MREYVILGMALIFVPVTIIVFIIIVAVKILCFHLADQKKRHRFASRRAYGSFDDEGGIEASEEAAATEAVVAVYFKAMEKVEYRTYKPEGEDNEELEPRVDDARNLAYLVQQK